jgi:transcriptional regulator with XRE-family HTH domain
VQARLGDEVRLRRSRAGLSQEALAQLSGLHRTYISDVERGRKSISVKTLCALANALQVRPHVLIAAAERDDG